MELRYSHGTPGPGRIKVVAQRLPVDIAVDSAAHTRAVHVRADGTEVVHVGPGGASAQDLHVIVGNQGLINSLADFFGIREGSTVSDGGSSSISIGRGSEVTLTSGASVVNTGNLGIYLSVPLGCAFDIRKHDGITVHYDGTEVTIEAAAEIGILERA